MKIAILGAGFSGLATAWHLMQRFPCEITIFDPSGIGGGASGLAAGLMHPYSGAHAKLNWMGLEGMQATKELLAVAAQTLGCPVAEELGVLRVALTQAQEKDFALCASKYKDAEWISMEACQKLIPGITGSSGIKINSGMSVNSSLYLQGLWAACEKRGAILIKERISKLQEVQHYDVIVVAMGAASRLFPELAHLEITPVKGQVLNFTWPAEVPHLPLPLNSHAYLVMDSAKQTCLAGATFERGFSSAEPDIDVAAADILPKVNALMPGVVNRSSLINCRAGLRASTPDHRPISLRINEKCWVLSGMGSKGLLYHSLFANKISIEIYQSLINF